jgi:uncharacterized protein (DUF1499 family)
MDGNVMSSKREFLTRSNAVLVVLALVSPWLLCQAWILVSAGDEPFETMPTCESTSMNCAHLGGDEDFRMDSLTLVIEAPLDEVQTSLEAYIEDQNGDVLSTDSTATSHYVHFVERTSFWRFPDDVVVGLTAVDEGTTQIELHSQSRLGQGDLGVNPQRLEGLHAALFA